MITMYYPLFIDFTGKKVLIVGGGRVGARRAKYLLSAGAEVTVLSKEFSKGLEDSKAELVKADAFKTDIDYSRYFLVVAATDDEKVNNKVSLRAMDAGALACNASDHTKGDIVFPMVADVAGHTLAYTTLGENPKLLAKIKKLIEDEFESK